MHKDPKVVDEILEVMSKEFRKLVISRGDEHDLLGMKIRINRKKETL